MAVVASLHSDTAAAAYIHMFFFVYFFRLEMREEEEQRRRLRLSGRRARRSWLEDGGVWGGGDYWRKHGGTFLPLLLTTNSGISLAQNPEGEGSSRWCTACPGRTWGTCDPEADLEGMEHSLQWSV